MTSSIWLRNIHPSERRDRGTEGGGFHGVCHALSLNNIKLVVEDLFTMEALSVSTFQCYRGRFDTDRLVIKWQALIPVCHNH